MTCNGKNIEWQVGTIDQETASTFMTNLVNEFGCFDSETNKVIANDPAGMKGQGWNGSPSDLTCLCPYGMSYQDSDNKNMNAIIGSNCIDKKPSNCNGAYIMGQCVDKQEPEYAGNLASVYLTWFWWPNLSEDNLLSYVNFNIKLCKAMQSATKSLPVKGLCFPLVTWPDNNNLAFMLSKWGSTMDDKRAFFGNWIANNLFENQTLDNITPGFLLYVSFKDGPWHTGFYSDVWNGQKTLINPITGDNFKSKSDFAGNPNSEWCWAAFFHFCINYIAPKCTNGKLPENFWIHLDKEGSNAEDAQFTQYDYTEQTHLILGPYISGHTNQPILFLASDIATKCDITVTDKGDACAYRDCPPVIVPEYYWGAGNQMPCDGSEGSYGYARTACTSLSSHRRLSGFPKAYDELITGNGEFKGADCEPGWLGNNNWKTATQNLQGEKATIWPSFSIENLSLCDLDDPNCYSQWQKLKDSGLSSENGGIPYSTFTNKTTVCNSMLFGSLIKNGDKQPLSQGVRGCGVFDGFSHWRWNDFVNFANYFSNKYKNKQMVLYEASFIPYHWIVDLGLQTELETILGGSIKSSLVTQPESSKLDYCPFTLRSDGCKAASAESPGQYCDADCKVQCKDPSDCRKRPCGKPRPTPGPNPGPNPGKHNKTRTLINTILIILAITILCVLIYLFIKYLLKRLGKKKIKYRKIELR